MARLVDELSSDPHAVQVSEIAGQGHWFNGVVDDPILQVYYLFYFVLIVLDVCYRNFLTTTILSHYHNIIGI